MTTTQQSGPASLAWPPITATVRRDGTAELDIAGARTQHPSREAALAACAATAASLGRPVQVTAAEPEGAVGLEVHPDGQVVRLVAPPRAGAAVRTAVAQALPELPGLREFRATRPQPRGGHASRGWQGRAHRLTRGVWSPAPGEAELAYRKAVRTVQRQFAGARTVVVANTKGGAPKTTTTAMLAATFGQLRGGWVVAADLNESQGTLGLRTISHPGQDNTVIDLLADRARFLDTGARAGDLDNYVRAQGAAHFDVLASSENPLHRDAVSEDDVADLHTILARFYRLILLDTGNSRAAANWRAAVGIADALVVPVSLDEGSADHAAAMLDDLRDAGHAELVAGAVTVLAHIDGDPRQAARVREHFGQVTRAVLEVPADPALAGGKPIVYEALCAASRAAWLDVAAAVAVAL